MKKFFKIGICMLLCICFSLSASAATAESSQTDMQNFISQLDEMTRIQQDAVAANALFESKLVVDKSGELVYPESFAGDFINDEGNLIIQVSSKDFSEYQYLKDKYPCVQFNRVEYSYSYLKEILDECLETYDENVDTFFRAYIDVKLNRAVVEVDEETLSHRMLGSENSPLVYKLGSPIYICSSSITGGDFLYNKTSRVYFSAGIGMTTSAGKDAIAACGHGMKVNDKIYLGNTQIGTVTSVSFSNYAKGDYSIITLNENADSTYNLYGRLTDYNDGLYQVSQNMGTYEPCRGEYVYKCTKNSGVAGFVIEQLDVRCYTKNPYDSSASTIIIDGQTMAGLMNDKFLGITGSSVKPGDSGSSVFYHCDGQDSLTSGDYVCGVISTYDTDTLTLGFTPVSRIQAYGTIKVWKRRLP